MALGNITLRSTSSSSVVNLKANVDASIDIVNRPLTHEEVDLNFLELGHSVKANQIGNFTTSDLLEGTNLYYTDARVGTYLSGTAKLGDLSDVQTPTASENFYHLYYDHASTSIKFGNFTNTDYLPEGSSNLYYTDARFDARLATKTTTNLTEGTNLYYTDARFDTRLGTKTTADLTEHATMLYFTNARADARADLRIAASSINALSDVDTTGIATNKILKWSGSAWVITDQASVTLTGLTDTTISGPSNGQVLKYNGSAWVNSSDSTAWDADLLGNTLTSSTGDIKLSTYADRNITTDLTSNASITSGAYSIAITGVTQANPGVVTANGHNWINGDRITITGVVGMTQLNTNTYTVANKTTNTFELSGTDTTGFTAYASGGTATRSASAVGDTLSADFLNTATNIGTATNLSDIKIKSDLLSGITFLQNTNNAGVSVDTGANLSAYHYGKNGNAGFNISLFNNSHPLFESYVNASRNGSMWQFKTEDRSDNANAEARVTIFSGDARGKIVHENRAYDNIRRYHPTSPITDAEAYGPINAEYKGKDLTLTATNDLKLKPTGKLDIGSTPGTWDATTQARIQKAQSFFTTTGLDNTQRHYNQAIGNKLTFGSNVDSGNRKQGLLTDTKFDLAGYSFGADNPTNDNRWLGNYDWTSLENSGSATTVSGIVGRHIAGDITAGTQNLTVTNVVGVSAKGGIDDATSSATNIIGLLAKTFVYNGSATNRYSIYAPEANDKAYFAGQIQIGAFTLPNTDGSANQVLKTNGSGAVTWQDEAVAGEPSFSVQTANFNATAGSRYGVNTGSNTVTATLPASPSSGDAIFFADAGGNYATNKLTLARNGNTIMGSASDMDITTNNQSVGVFYNGTTWRIY
jgi:hypothetical protein